MAGTGVGDAIAGRVEFADLDPDPAPDPTADGAGGAGGWAQQAAEDGRQREAAALRRWLKESARGSASTC